MNAIDPSAMMPSNFSTMTMNDLMQASRDNATPGAAAEMEKSRQHMVDAAERFNQKIDLAMNRAENAKGTGDMPEWLSGAVGRSANSVEKLAELMKFDTETMKNGNYTAFEFSLQMMENQLRASTMATEATVVHTVSTKISEVPKMLLERG